MDKLNYRSIADRIFRSGVSRVIPENLIQDELKPEKEILFIGSVQINLDSINKLYIIGAGKASAQMASGIERMLGKRIDSGHIVVKYGHSCSLDKIKITEAGHPVPDNNSYAATKEILSIAGKAGGKDLVICLLSGGGSALLADYPDNSSPGEMMELSNLLINSGATISEINAVRKHLSSVKGGQLARKVFPAKLVSLILSDVIGDPLDVIASGPTAPDSSTFQLAVDVLAKYHLTEKVPEGILKILMNGIAGKIPETPKTGDPIFENTVNLLIGTNLIALEASKNEAEKLGLNAIIINDRLSGDVWDAADYIIENVIRSKNDIDIIKPACLLFGGEPTVKMTGKGLGGRNQHLALILAQKIQHFNGITILCAGTDGTDGPTDAAGAVVDTRSIPEAVSKKIDPDKYLKDFDSFHFFEKTGGLIITGPTLTNVMDIIIVIIE